eukprot:COSAG05_NODE_2817_length_2609_cov_2.411952_2_plen_51_part_00
MTDDLPTYCCAHGRLYGHAPIGLVAERAYYTGTEKKRESKQAEVLDSVFI